MAKRYHKKHHHHHRRHNPLGISGGVLTDAAVNAGGALGSLYLSGLIPTSGWMSVLATGGAGVLLSQGGKMLGLSARTSEELLKGGLTALIIKTLHQMGVAQNIGLGLYSPSLFAIPTASDQYLRAAAATDGGYRRGAGSIWFPGPQGLALPAAIHPAAAAAAGMKGLGFHRFRSRYAGNY